MKRPTKKLRFKNILYSYILIKKGVVGKIRYKSLTAILQEKLKRKRRVAK